MHPPNESFTLAECEAEFDQLFPHGLSGPDIRSEIDFGTIIDIAGNDAGEMERDVCELVGRCVWDIFSDQHDVIAADGRLVDLGSFRAAGGFIADCVNRRTGRRHYDYMSFYLGTGPFWVQEHGDLTPIYAWIFRRLKRRRLDWVYHFPRLYLVDFRPLREALDREGKPDWEGYSPSEALAKEAEDRQRDQELAELREQIESDRNDAVEQALEKPPPATVQAYRQVYGQWPQGWPPNSDL